MTENRHIQQVRKQKIQRRFMPSFQPIEKESRNKHPQNKNTLFVESTAVLGRRLSHCALPRVFALFSGLLSDSVRQMEMNAKDGDDSRACSMVAHGLKLFLESWYVGELWRSFRSHLRFNSIIASRLQQHDVQGHAKILSGLSIGRQPSFWEDVKNCGMPLVLMYSEKNTKFKKIAEAMINTTFSGRNEVHEVVEIPNCGHAVHLENPLSVFSALRHFMTSL